MINEIVILCRRAINWQNYRFPSAAVTVFAKAHPVRELVNRWNATRGNPPFNEYRAFTHALAKETWQDTQARIVMNWTEPNADGDIQPHVLEICKNADWIIPIDDDDWLAPHICASLLTHPQRTDAIGAVWPSFIPHVDGESVLYEKPRIFLEENGAPGAGNTLLSCSYAISKAGFQELYERGDAGKILAFHGLASRYLLAARKGKSSSFFVPVIQSISAVHLRHRAAAGAANNSGIDLRVVAIRNKPTASTNIHDNWINKPLQKLFQYHANHEATSN